MLHRILARYRTCSAAIALMGAVALAFASAAGATTYKVSNTAEFEAAVTSANAAATGPNTIELGKGAVSPTKKVEFTNTKAALTIVGPATAPGAKLNGGAVEPFPTELLEIKAGVSVTLQNVTVTTGGGPGVTAISDFGELTVENSLIAGNNGAGMIVQPGATGTVRNSTLSDGKEYGLIDDGTASLYNTTVAFNHGGIENTSGILNLTNTIVAENGVFGNCSAAATSSDHSLDSDGSCGVGTLSDKNPKLNSKLFENGGPTSTHVLQVGSPAIGAGDASTCLATDQRGFSRSTPCSIGATEYSATAPTITVPSNITKTAENASGAVVTYSASASSSVAFVESFKCSPASGSTFAAGTTTVNCTATDTQGNTATKSFTVTVEAKKHTLTVTVTGNGTVTSTPAGIECGQGHSTCSAEFVEGEVVKMADAPEAGYSLAAWGGACSGTGACSVTMSANEAVSAEFSAVPVNTGLPVISGGTPQGGRTLSTSNGSWTGSPTSYTYQWEDCNTAGESCTTIAGATGNEYTLTESDLGHTIRVLVVADNATGVSAPAASAATAVVEASVGIVVEGKVPFTQTLASTCSPVVLGPFVPGRAAEYSNTCALKATSTAAESKLVAEDPSAVDKGHLVQLYTHGAFKETYEMPAALETKATSTQEGIGSAFSSLEHQVTLLTYAKPFSEDAVTVTFDQKIGLHDHLHTGTYAKTIVLTLSTTTP
jgi:HYR domain